MRNTRNNSKNSTRCHATGKRRFRDKLEAVQALHWASNARQYAAADGESTRRREKRTYVCAACRGYHLTSQDQRGAPTRPKPRPRQPVPGGRPRRRWDARAWELR